MPPRKSLSACRKSELHPDGCRSAFIGLTLSVLWFGSTALPAYGQAGGTYREPDYSKFKVEPGQYTLELWSWVGGLDQVVKEFEQKFPNKNADAGLEGSRFERHLKPELIAQTTFELPSRYLAGGFRE